MVGICPGKIFRHYCMVPFGWKGIFEVVGVSAAGKYNIKEPVAKLQDENGNIKEVCLSQNWPVKIPIQAYAEKLMPLSPW